MLEVSTEKTKGVPPKKAKEKISVEEFLVRYDGRHAE